MKEDAKVKSLLKKIAIAAVYFMTFGASVTVFVVSILGRYTKRGQHLEYLRTQMKKKQEKYRPWMLANAKDVYIRSEDELELHALEIEADEATHKYVILCHDKNGGAEDMGAEAYLCHNNGYHVLAPDSRGKGESEGRSIRMKGKNYRDITDWARRIMESDPDAEIVLYGAGKTSSAVEKALREWGYPENMTCEIPTALKSYLL